MKNNMIEIRYIQNTDKVFWYTLDRHLPKSEFDLKVRDKRGYVLLNVGMPIGILRYNLFWDNIPFCTLLYISDKYQRQGYGKKLMEYWENEMEAKGYSFVLTSTQANEEAQHFYRKLGYRDCGSLIMKEEPTELFLIKELKRTGK